MPYSISEQALCVTVSKYITSKCPGITQFFNACEDISTSALPSNSNNIIISPLHIGRHSQANPEKRIAEAASLLSPASGPSRGKAAAEPQSARTEADVILHVSSGHGYTRVRFGVVVGNEEWQGKGKGPEQES